VETSHEGKIIIVWNHRVLTDRTIPNIQPDDFVNMKMEYVS